VARKVSAAERRERNERALRTIISNAQLRAARSVAGLFKQPGEEGYNPDAAVAWKDATVATRAALRMVEGTMAAEARKDAAAAAPKVLGVVVVPQAAASIAEWEAKAQAALGPVIDVKAEPTEGGDGE